jgi:hypothetical protein
MLILACVASLLACALLAQAALASTTYVVSPTGSGTTCTEAAPCALTKGLEKALAGDSVLLEPGSYTLAKRLTVGRAISLGGRVGASTTILTSETAMVMVSGEPRAIFHDLRIEGPGPFLLGSASAERVFVSYTGSGSYACRIAPTTLRTPIFRDSVCWAHGGAAADATSIDGGNSGKVILRNDTFVGAAEASGLQVKGRRGFEENLVEVEVFNSIARGPETDVEVVATETNAVATVTLSGSNYATASAEGAATVTAPGTGTNQTAEPLFTEAAGGVFTELSGSPTIDAGANETANGTLALAGEARELGSCVGGPAVTDIGAYEFVPTAPC